MILTRRESILGLLASLVAARRAKALIPIGGSSASGGGGGGSFAPNRPAGLTNLVDRQWNPTDSTIPGGVLPPAGLSGTDSFGMTWFGGTPPIIATPASLSTTIGSTIPALPSGNPTAMAIHYPAGFAAGNIPFGCFYGTSFSKSKLYCCFEFLLPTNTNLNGNNIKWVVFANGGLNSRNHIMMATSGAIGNLSPPWLALQGGGAPGGNQNVGGAANGHTGFLINLSTPTQVTNGVWRTMEFFGQMESTPGTTSDGLFWAALDGTIVLSCNNIQYNTSGDGTLMNAFAIEPYYGGGGSNAPGDEYICVGHTLCAVGP